MNKTNHLAKLDLDCEAAIGYLRNILSELGVRTLRSFDLQSACASYPELTCPHHQDSQCDCQLVVLLAYGTGNSPGSLIVHSHGGQTEIDLVISPGNRPNRNLEDTIRLAFEAKDFTYQRVRE
jgi:hypothetical protein